MSQPATSPEATGRAKDRKEIGEYVGDDGIAKNRGGIVPAPGRPTSTVKNADGTAADPRRRMYLGKQRLGKRWTEIITAVDEGVMTWEEFVNTLSANEIARGQLRDKNGNFSGRPPAYVPRGFFDACQKVLMERGRKEWEKAYLAAVEALGDIASGKEPGAKVSDKIKAASLVIERLEGKAPEKIEVKISNPFQDLVEGVIAEAAEDAAIANAQDYYERLDDSA